MRKQKLPPFEELIERYCNSIQLRNPNKEVGEDFREKMINAWSGKDKLLYNRVKEMEITEHRINLLNKKVDRRVVEFQTGVDALGFPTFTTHIVRFENIITDPHRYKKQGSNFEQKLIDNRQIDFKEEINHKTVWMFN
jgi:hypothetical protein